MKISIIIFLLLIITFPFLFSKGSPKLFYKINDYLYVWAKNGLFLREKPSINSKILSKVLFSTQIKIDSIDKIDKIDGMKGYWISTKISNIIGYLFDGYLLKYPNTNKFISIFPEWAKNNLSLNKDQIFTGFETNAFNYSNLIIYSHHDNESSYDEDFIQLKDIRIEQAYLIIFNIFYGDGQLKEYPSNNSSGTYFSDNTKIDYSLNIYNKAGNNFIEYHENSPITYCKTVIYEYDNSVFIKWHLEGE